MAEAHADRDHATWSASASERRWSCPGSLAMEMGGPSDKESHAAAWGTAAHEVSEKCLRNGTAAIEYLDTTIRTKEHEILVDEEICETAQEYVDYVRGRVEETGADLLIEQKFSLAALKPPFDAGGTGDAVILGHKNRQIEIVDLKGGRGIVVEAKGNKQLRTYGLGAYMANPGSWDTIKVTIVQPRAPHPDGRIRSETFDVMDLVEWTTDLLAAMERAAQACVKYDSMYPLQEWCEAHLSAGDHCTFCKAKPTCPALQAKALRAARTHFDNETKAIAKPPPPKDLTMAQRVAVLDSADMIQGWLNAVRAHAQDLAESGIEVAHGDSVYGLTEKRARRAWNVEEDELVRELSDRTFLDPRDFYTHKPMSPAQVEKFLGKKDAKAALDGLVEQKSSGYNLTRLDKTNREAVLPPPQQFFSKQGES